MILARIIEKITVDRDYRLNITFFVTAEAFRQQVSQLEPQVHIMEAESCVTMQAILKSCGQEISHLKGPWGCVSDALLARDIRIVEASGSNPLCSTQNQGISPWFRPLTKSPTVFSNGKKQEKGKATSNT